MHFILLLAALLAANAPAGPRENDGPVCLEELLKRGVEVVSIETGSLLAQRFAAYGSGRPPRAPEVLAELGGCSLHTVYRDLAVLGLVPVGAWDEPLGIGSCASAARSFVAAGRLDLAVRLNPEHSLLANAATMRASGASPAQVRDALAIPAEWRPSVENRFLSFRGRIYIEDELLVELDSHGRTAAQIAAQLEVTPVVFSIDRSVRRTEAEVRERLRLLGAHRPPVGSRDTEIYREGYGYLKRGGGIEASPFLRFVADHYRNSDEWFQRQFGVDAFHWNGHLHDLRLRRLEDGRFEMAQDAEDAASFNRYQGQRYAVELTVDAMEGGDGVPPIAARFGTGPGKIGVSYVTATRRYFDGMEAFWLAVDARATERGVRCLLLRLRQIENPQRFRQVWQAEAADLIVDWIAAHGGRTPQREDFGLGNGELIPLDYERVTGTGIYAAVHPDKHESRFFDSAVQAFTFVKIRAVQRGVPCSVFLDFQFQAPSGFVRQHRRVEAADRILLWMAASGRYPGDRDFGEREGRLALTSQQLYATGGYRAGEDRHAGRIFDSPAQGRTFVRERAVQRGLGELAAMISDE